MIGRFINLFQRYTDRHLCLEYTCDAPQVVLELKHRQLLVRGSVPRSAGAAACIRLSTGGIQREGPVDQRDGSFALNIPFAPGPISLQFLSAGHTSADSEIFVIPGFPARRLTLAKVQLLPVFMLRLLHLLPQAWRWFHHKDPMARIALRNGLGLEPMAIALPLDEKLLSATRSGQTAEPEYRKTVLLIMPVFNAFEQVVEALSRLESNTSAPWHLLLVEDCSTDPQVRPFLRKWAERVNAGTGRGRVELLENDQNLGFVGTVNRGFSTLLQMHETPRDTDGEAVVLLNSDAFLPKNWETRLLAPFDADQSVASVTPMSNDAELLSVPVMAHRQQLRPGMADRLDQVAARLANVPDQGITLPTGVGFCMAISLAWLRRVGVFDPVFGAGYGEEVDWCRRALALGARHLAQPRLFVEHSGGASFGSAEKQRLLALNGARLSRRYPDFDSQVQDFIATDPLLSARLALGLAWAGQERKARSGGPVPVYLAHASGGGAEMDLARRLRSDIAQGGASVVLRVGTSAAAWQIELHAEAGVTMASTNDTRLLKRLLKELPERRIIYSCGVGFHDPVALPGVLLSLGGASIGGWEVLFHDYFPLSPSFTLLGDDGLFHGVPTPENTLDRAHHFHRPDGKDVDLATWQESWRKLMAQADRLEVFSDSSRKLVAEAFPQQAAKIALAPHKPLHDVPRLSPANAANPVIGVLGNIAPHKGADVLRDLSRILARGKQAKLVLLGQLDPAFRLAKPAVVHGQYSAKDLPDLVTHYKISAWLIPSVWPETFSFATHEALATGLPVFAFDLGAQGDLVRAAMGGGQGHILPLNAGKPDLRPLLAFIKQASGR